ncbi:MAG: TrkA family potassium uptake protein [Bacilli bacterium]|nr:TrkA family potassium uptake protein [Bacilli bacterium]
MKSFLVIGMGYYGRHLARSLSKLGNDVAVVDRDAEIINSLADEFTDAVQGDCTNPNIVKSLGVQNYDACFVATGENFQSSLEITSLLYENGAKYIASKASDDMQVKFLMKLGANEVIFPEHDMAERLAQRFNLSNVFNYIEIAQNLVVYETGIDDKWVGKTIVDLDIRKKYQLNILAIKKCDHETVMAHPHYEFAKGDHIIVLGGDKDDQIKKLASLIKAK